MRRVATVLPPVVLTDCLPTGVNSGELLMVGVCPSKVEETGYAVDANETLGEEPGQIVVVIPFITLIMVDGVEPKDPVLMGDLTAEEVLLL